MSEAAVKQFLAKVDDDLKLKTKLRNARNPDRTQTIANAVSIGSEEGFSFSAAEYESVVNAELKAVFANHRSIFHHHLMNVEV